MKLASIALVTLGFVGMVTAPTGLPLLLAAIVLVVGGLVLGNTINRSTS